MKAQRLVNFYFGNSSISTRNSYFWLFLGINLQIFFTTLGCIHFTTLEIVNKSLVLAQSFPFNSRETPTFDVTTPPLIQPNPKPLLSPLHLQNWALAHPKSTPHSCAPITVDDKSERFTSRFHTGHEQQRTIMKGWKFAPFYKWGGTEPLFPSVGGW